MSQSADRPFTPEQSVQGSSMEFSAIVENMIGKIYTATLVRVESVGDDDYEYDVLAPVGYLDAVSLIQQVDGKNQGIPNEPLFRIPYFRIQGGANAIVCDPKPGDIGIVLFAMRDISNIKDTREESAPPSRRQYDPSDGIYIGGVLNGIPEQYIQFLESGINIHSAGDVNLSTPADFNIECVNFNITCDNVNFSAESSFSLTASSAQFNLDTFDVECPQTTFSGNVSAANVSASGNIADSGSTMADIRDAYNSHTHISASPGNATEGPSEEV